MTLRKPKDPQQVVFEDHLPADQALLFTALREEFNAKIGSLKAWGIAALVGGQVFAGLMSAWLGPHRAAHVAMAAAHLLI